MFENNGTVRHVAIVKAVITAILLDPEARAGDYPGAPANPAFGHMREPVLFHGEYSARVERHTGTVKRHL